MRPARLSVASALLALTPLLLAGCGSTEADSPSPAASPPDSSNESEPEAEDTVAEADAAVDDPWGEPGGIIEGSLVHADGYTADVTIKWWNYREFDHLDTDDPMWQECGTDPAANSWVNKPSTRSNDHFLATKMQIEAIDTTDGAFSFDGEYGALVVDPASYDDVSWEYCLPGSDNPLGTVLTAPDNSGTPGVAYMVTSATPTPNDPEPLSTMSPDALLAVELGKINYVPFEAVECRTSGGVVETESSRVGARRFTLRR